MSHASEARERAREAASRRFSWRRALKHAAAAVAVVMVMGIIVAGISDLPHPQAAGRAIGGFLPVVAGVALLISYIGQTRSRGALVASVAALAVVVAVAVLGLRAAGGPRALSAAERAPLVIEGAGATRRLRHPTLGYSLALPEDLEPLPASMTGAMSKDPGAQATAWGNLDRGRVLIVLLSSVRSEANLRAFMDGMTDAQDALARQSPGAAVKTVRDELAWSGQRGEAHRHVTIGNSHVRFDAFGSPYGDGRVLTVGLFSFSRDDDSFAELAATLRPH